MSYAAYVEGLRRGGQTELADKAAKLQPPEDAQVIVDPVVAPRPRTFERDGVSREIGMWVRKMLIWHGYQMHPRNRDLWRHPREGGQYHSTAETFLNFHRVAFKDHRYCNSGTCPCPKK